MQTTLSHHEDKEEILMVSWYECSRCGHVWNELESIALCKKCEMSQNHVDSLRERHNLIRWLGAKDDKDLFNQKGADRKCLLPTEFDKKHNSHRNNQPSETVK